MQLTGATGFAAYIMHFSVSEGKLSGMRERTDSKTAIGLFPTISDILCFRDQPRRGPEMHPAPGVDKRKLEAETSDDLTLTDVAGYSTRLHVDVSKPSGSCSVGPGRSSRCGTCRGGIRHKQPVEDVGEFSPELQIVPAVTAKSEIASQAHVFGRPPASPVVVIVGSGGAERRERRFGPRFGIHHKGCGWIKISV